MFRVIRVLLPLILVFLFSSSAIADNYCPQVLLIHSQELDEGGQLEILLELWSELPISIEMINVAEYKSKLSFQYEFIVVLGSDQITSNQILLADLAEIDIQIFWIGTGAELLLQKFHINLVERGTVSNPPVLYYQHDGEVYSRRAIPYIEPRRLQVFEHFTDDGRVFASISTGRDNYSYILQLENLILVTELADQPDPRFYILRDFFYEFFSLPIRSGREGYLVLDGINTEEMAKKGLALSQFLQSEQIPHLFSINEGLVLEDQDLLHELMVLQKKGVLVSVGEDSRSKITESPIMLLKRRAKVIDLDSFSFLREFILEIQIQPDLTKEKLLLLLQDLDRHMIQIRSFQELMTRVQEHLSEEATNSSIELDQNHMAEGASTIEQGNNIFGRTVNLLVILLLIIIVVLFFLIIIFKKRSNTVFEGRSLSSD